MPRIAAVIVLLFIWIASALQLRPAAQTLPIIEDPESYAVYAALLQRRIERDPDLARDIRLLQETRPPINGCGKGREAPGWQPTAVENFWHANAQKWLLKAGSDLGIAYSLITPAIIEPILRAVARDPSPIRRGGPEPGLRGLPARYIGVSAVGFNAEKTFALVGDEGHCDLLNPFDESVLCSHGDITACEKIAGRWVVSPNARSCFWIA